MAKIPLQIGQEQLTRQPLSVRQQPGIFSAEIARASQELAQTAAKVAGQFLEAQTLAEKTNAETQALRGLKELSLEAGEQRTIGDISKFRSDYPNRISKIREEANKLISLPQAKNEFGRVFDSDKIAFDFSIRKTLQTNQNAALEVILNENMLEFRDSYITSDDAVTQHISKTKRNLKWQDAINRGIVTKKHAGEQIAKQDKEWDLARIDIHIEKDAESALEQLQLGEEGIYADVDAGDRTTKAGNARTKLERNKKIAKKLLNEKHTKNEIDLTQKYFTNKLFVDDIKDQFMSGDISQKYAGILNTLLTSPNAADPTTVEAEFGKLITAYLNLDESNLDELRKFRIKVLGFHGIGNLNRDDAQFLINKTVDPFTQKKLEGKGFLASTIEAIKSWAQTTPEPVVATARMVGKLLGRVDEKSTEEAITKAGQEIIKEQRKELNPRVGVADEKGVEMIDAYGNRARVFPDGRIEEIEYATTEE